MALLPPKDLIAEAIDGKKIYNNRPRSYIGYSGMANGCLRYLKLSFHWIYTTHHESRIERIFRRGDYEEAVLAKEFANIDVQLFDDQLEITGGHGYAKGHIDGKVFNVPGHETEIMLLEVKTMSDKRFKEYLKNGLRKTNPVYYGQIMSYMGKLGLKKCLYVVTNKNDEHRNYQIYDWDETEYNRLEDVANSIPLMEELPNKIGGKTWHACKYCDAKQFCHYNAKPRKSCRSCVHVSLEGEGRWSCGGALLSYEDQLKGCDNYILDGMFGVE